jgi:hypothetical protein
MPTSPEKKIWFPAKTHGWGWGPPVCWQGWVALALWFLLLLAGTPLLTRSVLAFVIYSLVLNAALIFLCWWKGEKPRWRWGDKTPSK